MRTTAHGDIPRPLCDGDACDVVTLTWDVAARCFHARNGSNGPVRVTLRAWPAPVEVVLDAGQTVAIDVTEFDQPFSAHYVR